MKTKKLLHKVKVFLSADQRAQQKKHKSLKKVLEQLAKKEAMLRKKLESKDDKQLRRKLKVVAAQRAKGARLIAQLEKKRKS